MRHSGEDRKPLPAAAMVVVGLAVVLLLYFLPFLAVLIDEVVLRSHWVSSNLPPWAEDVFRTVYWPLVMWFE